MLRSTKPSSTAAGGVAMPARRKGAAASREWLVVSSSSSAEARAEEFGKHRIMEITGLPARELRVLDPLLSYPSTILGREKAIVINLEHIKAIVTASEVLIPNSRDPLVVPFVQELQSRVAGAAAVAASSNKVMDRGMDFSKQKDVSEGGTLESSSNVPRLELCRIGSAKFLPFEFKALEVCLEYACRCLESETSVLEQEAYPALDELTSKISTLNLEHVRQIKSRLVALSGRVQKVRDELEHLLDDDMDMAEMYLTRKLSFQGTGESSLGRVDANKDTYQDDKEDDNEDKTESSYESFAYIKPNIEELEMLLEAYFVQIDGTLNKLYHLREYVDDTEDYINIMLDEKQNQLLQMGVMLTAATVIATAGVVVVSLFGMNIHIDLMKDPETAEQAKVANMKFWGTTWGTVGGCAILYVLALFWGKKSRILQ